MRAEQVVELRREVRRVSHLERMALGNPRRRVDQCPPTKALIVLASEFSRDLLIEGKPDRKVKDQVDVPDTISELKHYGMHRHFTEASSVQASRSSPSAVTMDSSRTWSAW